MLAVVELKLLVKIRSSKVYIKLGMYNARYINQWPFVLIVLIG